MSDDSNVTSNFTIWNEDGTKAVTTTTDGSDERLDVDSTIVGGTFQLQAYTPVFTFDGTTGEALTTSWTTLLDVTSTSGKMDFIASSLGSSNYKVRLTVDGVETFDIAMATLNTIGLANATNVEIWAETANKNFRYHPNQPIDFTTSLKVEAAMTTGTGTLYYMIIHREQA
jgi:hypothetical protein